MALKLQGSNTLFSQLLRANRSFAEMLEALTTLRNIFVSYHHWEDQDFYDKLAEVCANEFYPVADRSLEWPFESENPDYIMQRIRDEYITGTSCTIVLCGRNTPWRKYVDWEIKATLDRSHGLLGIALPNARRDFAGRIIVPDRLFDNMQTRYAKLVNWQQLIAPGGLDLLKLWIEFAKSSPTMLISNDRPLMKRNGIPPSDFSGMLESLLALTAPRK